MFNSNFKSLYWAIPNFLLAGSYVGSRVKQNIPVRLQEIANLGIDVIIDLTYPDEVNREGVRLIPYHNSIAHQGKRIQYYNIGIRVNLPPTNEIFQNILMIIESCKEHGKRVFVHCQGGKGRTGTIVLSYLVYKGLYNFESLHKYTQKVSKISLLNLSKEQLKFILLLKVLKHK